MSYTKKQNERTIIMKSIKINHIESASLSKAEMAHTNGGKCLQLFLLLSKCWWFLHFMCSKRLCVVTTGNNLIHKN